MTTGALSGIQVLDLSRLLPGPYCSMMLADLGAKVIKIEEPGKGDYLRESPPIVKKDSSKFLAINRNKKSMTLNLKESKGREIFLALVKQSDVVLESFRPGVMEKLGIGYNDLERVNSKIILCSISGYGQDGPFKNRAGHDINYLALAGILGFTGPRQGKPVVPGPPIADIGSGMLAAYCILAAIIARERIGKGQYIEISMLDSMLSWLSLYAGKYFVDGLNPKPSNERSTGRFAYYNIYKTKDGGYMSLGAVEPQFWSTFCKSVGREDLIKDKENLEKADKIINEISEIFLQRSKNEWIEFFQNIDCCCEPVNNFDEAFSHPQVIHRKMVIEIEHPIEGNICQLNFPANFSKTPAKILSAPPSLGQDNEEILKELGIDAKCLEGENIIG